MKINGHLSFHTLGDGEIQNAIIERLAGTAGGGTLPANGGNGAAQSAGRIAYNTDDNLYYYWNGSTWTPFSTGGDATALQTEVNNIETTLGSMINADGTANSANMDQLVNVTGATTISEVLSQLDAAIEGKDTLAELDDVTMGSPGPITGEILAYGAGAWTNQSLADLSIQAQDAGLDALAAFNTNGILVQTADNTFVGRSVDASTVAGDQGISLVNGDGVAGNPTVGLDIVGLTAEAGTPSDTDVLAMYDGTNNVKVSVANLKTAMVGANALGDLADVTDALAGSLTSGDSYFFGGNTGSPVEYEVKAATLGALNNVASGVDAASTEDVLAFDGTQWTAITVATMLADGSITDIGDVTVTTPAAGHVLYYDTTGSPDLGWVNGAPGATSGVQGHDDGLDSLAALTGVGYVVATADDTFVMRTIAGTAGNIVVSDGDGTTQTTIDLDTVTDSGAGDFEKITTDTFGRVTGTTPVVVSDITSLVDSTYVNVAGDTMTGNLVMSNGTDITLPDAPVSPTDAVNKSYVDGLVTSGTIWVDPIDSPDLVGFASTEPVSPVVSGMYIAYSGTGYPQTWTGGVSVSEYDMVHYSGGVWYVIGNINDGAVYRLGVGIHTAAISPIVLPGPPNGALFQEDIVEYIGGVGGDLNAVASWDFPHGRAGGVTFSLVSASNTSGNFVVSGDVSPSFKVGNQFTTTGTVGGTNDGTYTISGVSVSGDTTVTVEETVPVNQGTETGTAEPEIRDGTTALDDNELDQHFGTTVLYKADDNNWLLIGGPGQIGAGEGLYYSGSVLNIGLGAGVIELPSDEVGLDLVSGKAIQLTSTATGGQLDFVLDGTSLTQSASGLKISDDGVTAAMLDASVAGNGLEIVSTGSPLADSLQLDLAAGSGLDFAAGELTLTSVPNSALANSVITVSDDVATTDAVALGETLDILGTNPINTAVTANTVTISASDATTTSKGVAQFAPADFAVTAGTVTIKALGVGNAQLENSSITFAGDSGSSATALGGTRTIAGGTGVTTAEAAGTITINVDTLTLADVTDITAGATESGQVMVAGTPTGSPAAADYTPQHISYVHTQSTSATSWTVSHSLGQKFVNVTVYDSTDNVIIPQSIVATDANTTTVTFNTAITGTVVVMGVVGSATGSA